MLGFFKKKKKKDDIITEATGPVDAGNSEENREKVISQSSENDNSQSDNQGQNSNQQSPSGDNDVLDSAGNLMTKAAMSGMFSGGADISEMLKNIDTSGMSLKEKMGLKMLQKLPKKKQEELLRQVLNPQELYKHKDMIIKQIDEMVKAGQIDKAQAEAVKSQMGLR